MSAISISGNTLFGNSSHHIMILTLQYIHELKNLQYHLQYQSHRYKNNNNKKKVLEENVPQYTFNSH